MKPTQNNHVSGVDVQVLEVHEHRWQAKATLHHEPPTRGRSILVFHLWFIQEGYVVIHTGDDSRKIESGEVCLLPLHLKREIITPNPAAWMSLRLSITVFNKFNLMKNIPMPAQWRPDDNEGRHIESWMTQIVHKFRVGQPHYRLVADGLAQAVFGLCWPHFSSESLIWSIYSELPEWLGRTLRHISEDPSCTIADLARQAGFSPAQFRRSFHRHIGSTPRDYLKSQRLEAARHFLEHTDLSLRAIADRIGLRDADHFSQIFKEVYGTSPSLYRSSRMDGKEQ